MAQKQPTHPLARILTQRDTANYKAEKIEFYTGTKAPEVPQAHDKGRPGCVNRFNLSEQTQNCLCRDGNMDLWKTEAERFVADFIAHGLSQYLAGQDLPTTVDHIVH